MKEKRIVFLLKTYYRLPFDSIEESILYIYLMNTFNPKRREDRTVWLNDTFYGWEAWWLALFRKSITMRNTGDLKHGMRIRRRMIYSPYTVYHIVSIIYPCRTQTCRIRRAEIRYATAYSMWDYHVASDDRSILGVAFCFAPLDASRETRRAGETGAGEQERKDPSRCGAETKPTWPRVACKNKEQNVPRRGKGTRSHYRFAIRECPLDDFI